MNAAHNIIHIALKCLREILCVYFTIYILFGTAISWIYSTLCNPRCMQSNQYDL